MNHNNYLMSQEELDRRQEMLLKTDFEKLPPDADSAIIEAIDPKSGEL